MDVEEAIHYAIRRGAERIVLFGWSMGGTIAAQLALKPDLAPHIAALVLDSPVLDWHDVILANCARAGLPGFAGSLAAPWLARRTFARLVALPHSIPLETMSYKQWAADLRVPTLILHGDHDDPAPMSTSTVVRSIRHDVVELNLFSAGHTLSWNADSSGWRQTVRTWLARQAPSG
ncbi:alpha/beta hydrolase family protein [Leucobacter manosquensis]|uniref:alpha/beta hydrolase family protein n=1 Tax=Leucobacter manosquensis TaxID=2810611 RepID=UPI0032119757